MPTNGADRPRFLAATRANWIDALDRWSERQTLRVRGRNPALLGIRSARRFVDVRVTGLAAEMTYYALLSLFPLLTALAAGLGALEGIIGRARVDDLEQTLVDAVRAVMSSELTDDVTGPMIEDLLEQQRTGVAVTGLLLSLWLGSRVFRAAIRALDDAYEVAERRTLVEQWALSLALLLGALLLVIVMLSMLVIGPLLGGGREIAEWLGLGAVFETLWDLGRWPAVGVVGVAFLVWLYRSGPNVENTWRGCLPGAVLATTCLLLVTVGFRAYLGIAGPQTPDVGDSDAAVRVAAQVLGIVLVSLLYAWLCNICVLIGGVFNAEWQFAGRIAPMAHAARDGPERIQVER